MKNFFKGFSKVALGLFVFIAALPLINSFEIGRFHDPGIVEAKVTLETLPLDESNPGIQVAIDVQDRNTADLLALPEVVGTATGLNEAGQPAILVFTKNRVEAGLIPGILEGVPVVVKVTGEIIAMPRPPGAGGGPGGGGGGEKVDPTTRFDRPVPIGISTGNAGECSAGTIGARVTDVDNAVYALSNNHVYALENSASIGSDILQPGRFDTDCSIDLNNVIGTLFDFEPILFDGSDNFIDAAIALSSGANLGNSTPSNGYGTPGSTPVIESLNQAVQKYGRTSSLTKGTITGINATVNVGYGSGTAIFVDQIIVSSGRGAFIKPGDSGSLLVTDPGKNPVGLLFAGTRTGKTAIANRIDLVLGAFGVNIDGQ